MLRPIAAFSSGEASQYPYFAAIAKSSCISSAVGGVGCRFGSKGLASSRKNAYSFDLVTKAKVTGRDEWLRSACLTLLGITYGTSCRSRCPTD
jgi:hypothetical protein